jgi:hypothetical protein
MRTDRAILATRAAASRMSSVSVTPRDSNAVQGGR